ncbi:hypothetical protein XBI1_2660001 [Xenorhabdus bovienii str. Intermedium]|uniref:Transposase n=1 Tax=Xenorhabdus bovienii str. Intermedium TaxID=1379677 RepID=A0A077QMA1_XENBV|nr:hypothetical protein XBI1_2660001 [Xenorhabdus bovienii str. Intermedium]
MVFQSKPVSPSSMCEARMKIPDDAIKIINKDIVSIWEQNNTLEKWKGHRVFAIDSSKLNVPRTLLNKGYRIPQNTSRGSVALTEHQVSSLFFSESRTMSLIRNVFKRLHYPVDIIAQCVRGYLAYALSLRNLEEIMAERGIAVDR